MGIDEEGIAEEPKPEKVEAYRCPVCSEIIVGDYEKASNHTRQSVHEELPVGLAYFSLGNFGGPKHYELITHRDLPKLDSLHSPVYSTRPFMIGCKEGIMRIVDTITTLSFKEEFKERKIRLLTQEELEEFCRLNSTFLSDFRNIFTPVRTTPELEELVGELKR